MAVDSHRKYESEKVFHKKGLPEIDLAEARPSIPGAVFRIIVAAAASEAKCAPEILATLSRMSPLHMRIASGRDFQQTSGHFTLVWVYMIQALSSSVLCSNDFAEYRMAPSVGNKAGAEACSARLPGRFQFSHLPNPTACARPVLMGPWGSCCYSDAPAARMT